MMMVNINDSTADRSSRAVEYASLSQSAVGVIFFPLEPLMLTILAPRAWSVARPKSLE